MRILSPEALSQLLFTNERDMLKKKNDDSDIKWIYGITIIAPPQTN